MRLNDLRSTNYVDDRRGRGFGGSFVGAGVFGLIVIVVALFLGVDPSQLLNEIQNGVPDQQQTTQQNGPQANEPEFQFAKKIIGSAEDVWTPILAQRGVHYQPATFTPYDGTTQTDCGTGLSIMGPFYCPNDRRIYIDLSFLKQLGDKLGAPGQLARAYVISHEFGHHIQNLMGTMDKVEGRMQAMDEGPTRNRLSERLELQADCYAGVYIQRADARFHILEKGDVDDALRAASAVGDDTIENREQGYVVPDSFTHGTAAQRTRWFKRGLAHGDMNDCDTFSVSEGGL